MHLPSDYTIGKEYIFDGRDLFRNFTPQPPSTKGIPANGYAALLVWDRPENGGNGDGLISSADQAVQRGIAPGGIVLWIDDNHDGIAQPEELHTFSDKGLESIVASEYKDSHWTDYAGNRFRYTAPVHLVSRKRGRSVDVFFVLGESSSK